MARRSLFGCGYARKVLVASNSRTPLREVGCVWNDWLPGSPSGAEGDEGVAPPWTGDARTNHSSDDDGIALCRGCGVMAKSLNSFGFQNHKILSRHHLFAGGAE